MGSQSQMDLEINLLSEVLQREKDKKAYDMQNLKHDTIYLRDRSRLTDVKNRLAIAGGVRGRYGLRAWDQQIQTVTYRMCNQQGPAV